MFPMYTHQEETAAFIAKPAICREYIASDPGCVSADTEYLTPTGWKRIDNYTEGDLVAEFHPKTKTAKFVEPTAYIKRPCKQMFNIKPARGTNQMLSSEHRVLFYPKDGKPNEYRELPAIQVVEKHKALKNGFQGRFATACTLETEICNTLNVTQCRVMTMVIADGTLHKDCINHCSVNIKKERKKERAEVLLTAANIPFKRSDLADGFTRFYFKAPLATKVFDKRFWKSSIKQRQAILDESQYWDGSLRKNGSFSFSSAVKMNADFIQFCAFSTNRTASLRPATRERRGRIETEYVVHVRNTHQLVGIESGTNKSVIESVPTEDGYKYCFSVPSTYLLLRRNGYVFATGNTGKTRSVIEGLLRREGEGKILVLAPLSILEPSWGNDIRQFAPDAQFNIAHGKNRDAAVNAPCHFTITNHDAVKWLSKMPSSTFDQYDTIVVDESTAFKNRNSDRSKCLKKLSKLTKNMILMSGTPNSNTVCDLWHQYYLLDEGERLSPTFYKFQNQMCIPEIHNKGGRIFKTWTDRPDAIDMIADMVKDITIRHKFEDCIDIPEHSAHTVTLPMPAWVNKKYQELAEHGVLETEHGVINTAHAGAKIKKMLQLLSGALYDERGQAVKVHEERYNLVMEMIKQRDHCVIGFNWKHEVEALKRWAAKPDYKFDYAVIDGSVSMEKRAEAVERFQAGELKCIFAHPQSAGHGLTLTRGTSTIWCSPTYNAEHYQQFNRRIYRAGQKRRTETIRIAYAESREIDVYEKLDGKLERMDELLDLMYGLSKIRRSA